MTDQNQPLPHTRDTAATWLIVAGLILLGIVLVITAAAGPRAGLAAAIFLIVLPSAATGILAITYLAADTIRRTTRGRRLRLRYHQGWGGTRPAIVLTDTPRPHCPDCHGQGGWTEYGERLDVLCDCWTSWSRALLALPRPLAEARYRRAARRARDYYSQEPPF